MDQRCIAKLISGSLPSSDMTITARCAGRLCCGLTGVRYTGASGVRSLFMFALTAQLPPRLQQAQDTSRAVQVQQRLVNRLKTPRHDQHAMRNVTFDWPCCAMQASPFTI